MNENFINIKVDREERPDINELYMTVAQLLIGRGGWPLTIIMSPDQKPFYARTAQEILAYVLRDRLTPEGGFASAEDADSEGEEGRFYTWSYEELSSFLGPEDLAELEERFALRAEGNYKDEATGEQTGRNILYMRGEAGPADPGDGTAAAMSDSTREKLFHKRRERVRPFKDDKILTSWNGLMIAALARLRSGDGGLLHRYREGEAAIPGYSTDYACLIWGLIELYEALNAEDLRNALDAVLSGSEVASEPQACGASYVGHDRCK